jgi:outer membrane murein-binding lipoprotein Lpp
VFSLSALDLFASAMGTFILISIVLFPYYLKNQTLIRSMQKQSGKVETLKRRIRSAEGQERAARAEAAKARAEAEKWRSQISKSGGPMKLPKGGEKSKSLEFAKGCWRTDPFRHSPRHKEGVSQYCFDKEGKGNLMYYRTGEAFACATYATIKREGPRFTIQDADARCNIDQKDKGVWTADKLECAPDASGIVWCEGSSGAGSSWRVRLYRQ